MAIFYRSKRPFLIKNKLISKYATIVYGLFFFGTLWYVLTRVFLNLLYLFDLFTLLIASIIVFGPILYITRKLMNSEKKLFFGYNSGLVGEISVENELTKLSDEYIIFCDIKIPPNKGNIDFVVVGPSGLLVLEVKNHKGEIGFSEGNLLRNGSIPEKNFLRQVKGNARSVSKYLGSKLNLEFYVKPLLIFSNPRTTMTFGLKPVDNVYIINKYYLERLMHSFRSVNWNFKKQEVVKVLEELSVKQF
jgi:hypothetical protein